MADFDSPVCKNCPIPMRLRHYFSITIFQRNKLTAQGKLIELDSLQTAIQKYLADVGVEEMAPENFKQVNYRIFWYRDSDLEFLNSVLTTMYISHLSFVTSELKKEGIDFCKMQQEDLEELKEKYPLRIEFDLGKINEMKPPQYLDPLKPIEAIEIEEEIELMPEI